MVWCSPRTRIPQGPYIIAVSIVSPFIKFKNASKETVDASDELVEELRLAMIQAGQKLSKHIRREAKANELEEKIRHIEQFGPILVEGLCRITKAPESRKKKAEEGLLKLLGRDANATQKELDEAHALLEVQKAKQAVTLGEADGQVGEKNGLSEEEIQGMGEAAEEAKASKGGKGKAKKSKKSAGKSAEVSV